MFSKWNDVFSDVAKRITQYLLLRLLYQILIAVILHFASQLTELYILIRLYTCI